MCHPIDQTDLVLGLGSSSSVCLCMHSGWSVNRQTVRQPSFDGLSSMEGWNTDHYLASRHSNFSWRVWTSCESFFFSASNFSSLPSSYPSFAISACHTHRNFKINLYVCLRDSGILNFLTPESESDSSPKKPPTPVLKKTRILTPILGSKSDSNSDSRTYCATYWLCTCDISVLSGGTYMKLATK